MRCRNCLLAIDLLISVILLQRKHDESWVTKFGKYQRAMDLRAKSVSMPMRIDCSCCRAYEASSVRSGNGHCGD